MKTQKILIFLLILIASIYLSSAVNIVLNSGQKLDNNSWTNLSSVLNKVDTNSANLNINGKLSVDGKICDTSNNCLGECKNGEIWDTNTNSCKSDCPSTYNGKGTTIHNGKCYYQTGKVIGINNTNISHFGTFVLNGRLFMNGVYSGGTTTYAGGQIIGNYNGYNLRYESGQTGAIKTRWRERLEVPK